MFPRRFREGFGRGGFPEGFREGFPKGFRRVSKRFPGVSQMFLDVSSGFRSVSERFPQGFLGFLNVVEGVPIREVSQRVSQGFLKVSIGLLIIFPQVSVGFPGVSENASYVFLSRVSSGFCEKGRSRLTST